VAFTAPANVGGSAITSYAVQSTPGGIGATGSSSPITVSGLTARHCLHVPRYRAEQLRAVTRERCVEQSCNSRQLSKGQEAYTTAGYV
jgi:hypothetical protein